MPATQEQGVKYPWRDLRPKPGPPNLAARKRRDAAGRHVACGRPTGMRNGPRAALQAKNVRLQVENPPTA
ncbi:hypothetical protein NDU88_005817 [Pleurodeles waltl]|uniref:Uncharacterized protein n=1 Tax=Pleurodeles waltl TaxID=8319 RepID=A0AAV7WY60_PLEWA|nr:hypothetical protein NDU88_005817 [Pleurodeles waltl]